MKSGRGVAAFVILAVVLAFGLRVAAALLLGPHVDEAESVLAARMVADTGVPVLPSGVVFLQGLTLTYLLPWFDWGTDPFNFAWLRLVSVLAGTAAVAAAWPLARAFGASRRVAGFVVFALATDGSSIEWSAHVRPYALLQLETSVLLTLWLGLLQGRSITRAIALGVVFALGVYTHVGIALVLPAMLGLSWLEQGRALVGARRDLGLALASFALPLLSFVGINTWSGVTTRGAESGGPGFIGDHVLALGNLLRPQLDPWADLFQRSGADEFIPLVMVFSVAVLLMRREGQPRTFGLLLTYAVPIAAVIEFTIEAQPRYLLHLHPMSWIIIGMGLEELWEMPGPYRRGWRVLALVGLWIAIIQSADGARVRLGRNYIDPDYPAALRWLQTVHEPGEPVLAAMTSVTAFSPIPQSDFRFLAGPADVLRTARYTRIQPDGRVTDYWSGVPAITSTPELCEFLREHPGTWFVVDNERLRGDWAFGGLMQAVILGTTEVEHPEADVVIYRSLPSPFWTEEGIRACEEAELPPDSEGLVPPEAPGG